MSDVENRGRITMELVSMGVFIMDMFPSETGKRLVEVPAYIPTPGGAMANVAVAAARLGLKSAFIGKVGDDAFGHYLADIIKREGVDSRGLRFDRKARTTMNFHAKLQGGVIEYLFYRNPGADTTLRIDELDTELIQGAKVLHFDSLCLTDEPMRSTMLEAIHLAERSGAVVSFDVNYRPVLWETPGDFVRCVFDTLPKVDIVKLNDEELILVCPGKETEDAAAELVERGPKLCLVTRGSEGSYFRTKIGGCFIPAFDVEVKDTIGCGDAFIGGFLTRMIKEGLRPDTASPEKIADMVRYADTVAALTATKYGGLPALPLSEEVEMLYKGRRDACGQ